MPRKILIAVLVLSVLIVSASAQEYVSDGAERIEAFRADKATVLHWTTGIIHSCIYMYFETADMHGEYYGEWRYQYTNLTSFSINMTSSLATCYFDSCTANRSIPFHLDCADIDLGFDIETFRNVSSAIWSFDCNKIIHQREGYNDIYFLSIAITLIESDISNELIGRELSSAFIINASFLSVYKYNDPFLGPDCIDFRLYDLYFFFYAPLALVSTCICLLVIHKK